MKPNNASKAHRQRSRGVALITTLLLLSLFTVMTLAMVIATSSDLLIDGYYRNLRGSFYAADSGMNAARQYLANQLFNSVTPNYPAYSANPPIPVGTEATIMATLGTVRKDSAAPNPRSVLVARRRPPGPGLSRSPTTRHALHPASNLVQLT